jgi:uncharacterized phosphatase
MGDMMILALMRHGETNYNKMMKVQGRVDIPLNMTGKRQIEKSALTLKNKNINFDQIGSSPLSRSLESAMIIKEQLHIKKPLLILPYFIERDFGPLDEKSVHDVMPFVRKEGFRMRGYEHDERLIKRIVNAAYELYIMKPNQQILVVAHSHVIKALRIYASPANFDFKDLIEHGELFYFEISKAKIKYLGNDI